MSDSDKEENHEGHPDAPMLIADEKRYSYYARPLTPIEMLYFGYYSDEREFIR